MGGGSFNFDIPTASLISFDINNIMFIVQPQNYLVEKVA